MPDIYNKCFIGLRLTINDGNANTVQEMEKMGLMVVHNGNHLNSLKWKNEDDIIYHITIEFINKYLSAKKYTDKIFNSYVIISNHKNFMNLNSLKEKNRNIHISTSIANVFKDLNEKNEVHWLWKWFLALAIVSLLLEILILKFYKP